MEKQKSGILKKKGEHCKRRATGGLWRRIMKRLFLKLYFYKGENSCPQEKRKRPEKTAGGEATEDKVKEDKDAGMKEQASVHCLEWELLALDFKNG